MAAEHVPDRLIKNPIKTSTHLRNTKTGLVVPWNELKAMQSYMEPYNPPEVMEEEVVEPTAGEPIALDPERIERIVAVIPKLHPKNDYAASGVNAGKPKATSISAKLGLPFGQAVKGVERDEAWRIYQERNATNEGQPTS